jgi:hypothetical protein
MSMGHTGKLYSFLQEDRTEEEIRDFCDTNGKNAKQQNNQNS